MLKQANRDKKLILSLLIAENVPETPPETDNERGLNIWSEIMLTHVGWGNETDRDRDRGRDRNKDRDRVMKYRSKTDRDRDISFSYKMASY